MHCGPGLMFVLNIIIFATVTWSQNITTEANSPTNSGNPMTINSSPETRDSTTYNSIKNENYSIIEEGDEIEPYYPHTLNGTVYRIFVKFDVNVSADVLDLITLLISKNISTYTVGRGMLALMQEMDAEARGTFLKEIMPRLCGLHRKLNSLVTSLAALYGFKGENAVKYGKLIHSIPLRTILTSALEGARAIKDTVQYNKVLTLAQKIEKMDGKHSENIYTRYG